MLIAMAGLPGTGKSFLAARLESVLEGVILNKDHVRAVLFPPRVLDYSREEDDLTMAAIYRAVAHIRKTFPRRPVIIDGRSFLRSYQVQDLLALAASIDAVPRIIECVCDDEIVRRRLEEDRVRGDHPAGNRSYELYRERKAEAEPVRVPHLVLDMGRLTGDEAVERCLAYLQGNGL